MTRRGQELQRTIDNVLLNYLQGLNRKKSNSSLTAPRGSLEKKALGPPWKTHGAIRQRSKQKAKHTTIVDLIARDMLKLGQAETMG